MKHHKQEHIWNNMKYMNTFWQTSRVEGSRFVKPVQSKSKWLWTVLGQKGACRSWRSQTLKLVGIGERWRIRVSQGKEHKENIGKPVERCLKSLLHVSFKQQSSQLSSAACASKLELAIEKLATCDNVAMRLTVACRLDRSLRIGSFKKVSANPKIPTFGNSSLSSISNFPTLHIFFRFRHTLPYDLAYYVSNTQ